jgi:translation elongation factor aEF-1 beta
MGKVVGNIRVMPAGVLEDDKLNKMIDDIKTIIKPPAQVGKIQVKNVAFGLRGLDVTVLVPDDSGGIDPIAEEILGIENVETAEVTDVGLL